MMKRGTINLRLGNPESYDEKILMFLESVQDFFNDFFSNLKVIHLTDPKKKEFLITAGKK